MVIAQIAAFIGGTADVIEAYIREIFEIPYRSED